MKTNCDSLPDSITEASNDFLHNISGMLRPREVARHCPNCGKLCWDSELNYSSSIKTAWGGSTLYGVCKECADNHSKRDESNYR